MQRIELLQCTLDPLIRGTLVPTSAVQQRLRCPALHRLIECGWMSVEDGTSEHDRRARVHRLTAKRRRRLHVENARSEKLARAIANVLKPASENSL